MKTVYDLIAQMTRSCAAGDRLEVVKSGNSWYLHCIETNEFFWINDEVNP